MEKILEDARVKIGNAQLVALYWLLRNAVLPYQEQTQQMDNQRRKAMIRHHLKRLSDLGYKPA